MPVWAAVALGGALGSVLRFWLSGWVYHWLGRGFPYGTLTVNILGSLLIGFLSHQLLERSALAPEWRAAILVGVLGGFTTFSTFSLETVHLLTQAEFAKAATNAVVSLFACLAATWLGFWLARMV